MHPPTLRSVTKRLIPETLSEQKALLISWTGGHASLARNYLDFGAILPPATNRRAATAQHGCNTTLLAHLLHLSASCANNYQPPTASYQLPTTDCYSAFSALLVRTYWYYILVLHTSTAYWHILVQYFVLAADIPLPPSRPKQARADACRQKRRSSFGHAHARQKGPSPALSSFVTGKPISAAIPVLRVRGYN